MTSSPFSPWNYMVSLKERKTIFKIKTMFIREKYKCLWFYDILKKCIGKLSTISYEINSKYGKKGEYEHPKIQWTSCCMTSKRFKSRHTVIKLGKDKDEERILKAARDKWLVTYNNHILNNIISSFLTRNIESQR